jgi:light-harvesting complex I chlorophyll a/b binding protein 1
MLSLSFAATAFTGPAPTLLQPRTLPPMMAEKSAAIPFLNKPPALDGTIPGDVGFDPLGFSTTITELGGDLNYVREAELMHGRQAMLACLGFVGPSLFGKLPVAWTSDVSLNPLEAQYQLPPAVFYQLAISIFIAEGLRAQIIFNGDRIPGDHGFDPFGWAPKDPAALQVMKTKEILNGRLAMIAIVGFYAQLKVTGHIWPLI